MSQANTAISIEPLQQRDLFAALNIQAETYPPFLVEGESVFLGRINLAASYCLAAKHEGELLGYMLAHGWSRHSPPSLGAVLSDGVPNEILFIHDMAVQSSKRGLGVGQALIDRAFELAVRDGLRSAELIAVEGAADYWRRVGFVDGPVSGDLLKKLAQYGALARWMTREIS